MIWDKRRWGGSSQGIVWSKTWKLMTVILWQSFQELHTNSIRLLFYLALVPYSSSLTFFLSHICSSLFPVLLLRHFVMQEERKIHVWFPLVLTERETNNVFLVRNNFLSTFQVQKQICHKKQRQQNDSFCSLHPNFAFFCVSCHLLYLFLVSKVVRNFEAKERGIQCDFYKKNHVRRDDDLDKKRSKDCEDEESTLLPDLILDHCFLSGFFSCSTGVQLSPVSSITCVHSNHQSGSRSVTSQEEKT